MQLVKILLMIQSGAAIGSDHTKARSQDYKKNTATIPGKQVNINNIPQHFQ